MAGVDYACSLLLVGRPHRTFVLFDEATREKLFKYTQRPKGDILIQKRSSKDTSQIMIDQSTLNLTNASLDNANDLVAI